MPPDLEFSPFTLADDPGRAALANPVADFHIVAKDGGFGFP